MYPQVVFGFHEDVEDVEPPGRDWSGYWYTFRCLHLGHAEVDVSALVSLLPVGMRGFVIHDGDRAFL
jgi:hypothetical protein